ncbi:MAG: EamA family transporter [Bacteroidota bacterium]|nr:EamA family transporter [Bacteroidota bacterium]MDP4229304.1 EamA family transporter [Bacteroidota bacterium]MDP4234871.1 EamA family transporter [Bacteroidota bacterium]
MIYFLLFIQQTIASMTHIVGKDAVETLSPSMVLTFRALIASVSLLLFVMMRERRFNLLAGITKKDRIRIVFLGLLNIPINQFLYLEGLKYTTPANSALLYALTPAIVFLFALRVHWEKLNWKKTSGIAIAFLGVAIIMFEHGATLDSANTKGNLLIFVAVVAWSLFTFLGKPLVPKYGALRVTALHMTIGTLLFLPIGLGNFELKEVATISGNLWIELVYLGLLASCVNYVLWYYALGKLETSKVAIFQNLQPILTTVIALMIGKVVLSPELFGGGVLALIGVLLVERG